MRKLLTLLSFGIVTLVLLILNIQTSAQSRFRVQMKLPPAGKVGTHYAYQALNLYNNESGSKTIRLKVIVSEASAGTVYEAESGNFECPPGYSTLDPAVIQSVNVTQVNPVIADYIKRSQSLPGGKYTLCVTVFVAGSNSPTARDCYEESVIVTDPALQKQAVTEKPIQKSDLNNYNEMFGIYAYSMSCNKSQVHSGDTIIYTIALKSKSLTKIQGIRMKVPFPAEYTLQGKALLINNGKTIAELEPVKFACQVENGSLLLNTEEEIAYQEEMILFYTVSVNPVAQSTLIRNNNIIIETSVPDSRNTVKSGPLINIVR